MANTIRNAFLVLGMHRSGTSALTRVLNLLGAALPDSLLEANEFNATGYWEPTDVVAVNQAWLRSLSADWDAPFIADDAFELPATAVSDAANVIKAAYGLEPDVIALKDPRSTLFAHFWRQALENAGYTPHQVIIHRPAGEVVQSLAHRDDFTPDEAALLWAWYGVKALIAHRDAGGVVITYAQLRQDWRQTVEGIRTHCGLSDLQITGENADAIDAFLAEPRSGSEADFSPAIAVLVEAVDAAYALAARGKSSEHLDNLLHQIIKLSGSSRAAIVRVRHESDDQIAELQQERDKARSDHAEAQAVATRAFEETKRVLENRDRLQGILDEKTDSLNKAEASLSKLEAGFVALESSVAAYQAHAEDLARDLSKTQSDYRTADAERQALRIETVRLKAIENSSLWKATTPVRQIMSRMPLVRSMGRKALKAGWWTVTGQLSARLKARKAAQLAVQLDASQAPVGASGHRESSAPVQALNGFLTAEFEAEASYVPELISRYGLSFQSEGQPPITTVVEDEPARRLAERLAKRAAQRPMVEAPEVSIIIPAYNQIAYTLACIESVFASAPRVSFEILVGDDQSTDGTQAAAALDMAHVRWVRHETNQGFVGNCNLTAAQARGRILVMLNNDTLVLPGWLDALVATLDEDDTIGLAGSKLVYPDGRLQEAGGIFWQDGSAWNLGRFDNPRRPEFSYARDVDYISGAAIALSKTLWETLDGFDDAYRPAYAEDADLAFRIRDKGLRTVFQSRSMLIHFEGVSSGTDLTSGAKAYQVTNLERLRERWAGVLAAHRPNGQNPELEKERGVHKRALFIDITTPEPQHDAGSLVAVETMRALQALDYKVTFVPVDNFQWTQAYSAPLQAMGVETIYHPFYSQFEPFIAARGAEFDLIIVHRFGAAERVLTGLRAHAPQAKIAFMPADLHFLREGREADLVGDANKAEAAAQTKTRELDVIRSVDAVLPHSTTELDVLAEEAPQTPRFQLPLIFEPDPVATGFHRREGVGFIGGFGHPPNADAVDWFLAEIWPRVRDRDPKAVFTLAGSKMPDRFKALHGKNGVNVLGYVEHLEDFFGSVRASVAPLRYGAGAKGKVAASLAAGTPCISTSIGAEGMGLNSGVNIWVADQPEAFAEAIVQMLGNEQRWTELRQGGLAYAEDQTSRAVVRQCLSDMVQGLALR